MKIAYCGYDFFSAGLQELLVTQHEIQRIFTVSCDNRFNYNQYIYQIGQRHGIPVTEQQVDAQILNQLRSEGCELLITAAYYYKIPDLSATGLKGINVHPTLLPVGRGVWPLPWTLLTGQSQSGVTIHKLAPEYDAGDILLQQAFPIATNECLESLSAKVQMMAKSMIVEVTDNLDRYWQSAQPQTGEVSVWNQPSKEQRTLNWHHSVEDLDRTCRAFGKFGCFADFDNRHWVVYGLAGWQQLHPHEPGTVVHKTNTEMIIAASDGLVSLLYFEPVAC
ncbi:MAG: formyltransferase family protein [Gammaproteobacteria bacterium]|jgi:methionyl-tRNA formyltransferase